MRKAGLVLATSGWIAFLYASVATLFFVRAHPHHEVAPEYAAVWPVSLAVAVGIAGIVLVLIPVRRGEPWAWWTLLVVLGFLLAVRMATDPRCLVVLDVHQHGCHTFMIAVVLAAAGLALLRPRSVTASNVPMR